MKVLVTGSEGFLGKYIVKKLLEKGHKVISFAGDITSLADIRDNLSFEPDIIIHLAAISSVVACELDSKKAFEVNTLGTFLLVEEMNKMTRPSRLIFPSSAHVYASSNEAQINEDFLIKPFNIYGKTKRAAELIIQENLSHIHDFVILRLFNHTHKTQDPSFFLPSIYSQLLEIQKSNSDKMDLVVGNVDLIRDLGALKDLIAAFLAVVEDSGQSRQIYNLSSGFGKSLRKILNLLSDKLNLEINMMIDPTRIREGEPEKVVGNSSKFQSRYDWKPTAISEADLVESFLGDIN